MMKRFLSVVLLFCIGMVALCDDGLDGLLESFASNRVTMNYVFKSSGGKVTLGSGTVTVNGNWYVSRSKALDIYCDGQSRWLVDSFAKEVYIEDAGGSADYISSLDSYLKNVPDLKLAKDSASGTFIDPSSGEPITFSFSGMKKSGLRDDVSEFRFSPESLGGDWVITDLRTQ